MSDPNRRGADSFLPPTEVQMSGAGRALLSSVRNAISHNRLIGFEPDTIWEFEIEGSGALASKEDYVRKPTIAIFRADYFDTEVTRSFIVSSSWINENDEIPYIADIFKADLYKNTEILAGLSKATIDSEFLRHTDTALAEKLAEAFESFDLVDESFPNKIGEALALPRRRLEEELLQQMAYGMCNQDETIEFIEMLQRAKPTSSFGSLGSISGIVI